VPPFIQSGGEVQSFGASNCLDSLSFYKNWFLVIAYEN
jgi:hypothetical protein